MILLQPWQNFYILTGTAAATLAGLLFVSLSYGMSVVKGDLGKAIKIWAEPILFDFIQVLVISSLALFPDLNAVFFGIFLLAYVALRWTRLLTIIRHFSGDEGPADLEWSDWMEIVILQALAYLLLAYCGLGFVFGWPALAPGLAVFTLLKLVLGIINLWSQTVWMAVETHKKRK